MTPLARVPARWLALLLLLPACAAWSAGPALYTGEAEVASQDADERARAAAPALLQALVKASGDGSLATDGSLVPVLARAPQLLRSYSYRQDVAQAAGGQTVSRLLLVAQFDADAVQRILADLRRPLWGERPRTLVLLVIADGSSKRVASDSQIGALGALTGAARERGLTLQLPRMDPTDIGRIDPFALWDGAPPAALAAAERYDAPVALIVRLARSGNGWAARNSLLDATGTDQWSGSYADANAALAAAVAGLAERLAQRYAIPSSERVVAEYRMWIAGLDSAAAYGSAISHLRSLSVVSALATEGADGDRVLVRMTLGVTLPRLRQMLALHDVLSFDDGAAPDGAQATLRLVR